MKNKTACVNRSLRSRITSAFEDHLQALDFLKKHERSLESMAGVIVAALRKGGKVMAVGNGGSASDAQHLAAELVGRFKKNRAPLAAIALTTNTSILTAVGNDFGYDEVFRFQVEAVGRKGDILIVLSTSGNSVNIIKAVEAARSRSIYTIGLLGKDGGRLKHIVDLDLTIPFDTPRAQEMHGFIGHVLSELIEETIFPHPDKR